MTLIKSISGIRGTVGGLNGSGFTPIDVVKFAAGYGTWLKQKINTRSKVIIGRDARPSGNSFSMLVSNTLMQLGIDVIDLGLSTTPTLELAIVAEKAQGGIMITASHNPAGWNALKLMNQEGEYLIAADGEKILEISDTDQLAFVPAPQFGNYTKNNTYLEYHVEQTLKHSLVDIKAIQDAKFRIVVDAVNSTGGLIVPMLLKKMGVEVTEMFCEPTGNFPHNPEPLPENLQQICNEIESGSYHLGIVVDPDVDRLAFIQEDGQPFGEEYTLVAVADYVLQQKVGNTVSNLSSSRALKEVTERYGGTYFPSQVGEVHVVAKMKEVNAIIGGEGNGGVIFPDLHYGRDALAGIALFLTFLAKSKKSASILRAGYPNYHISKNKIELSPDIKIVHIMNSIAKKYAAHPVDTTDGVKIAFENEWVHLRQSNTEPFIRVYAESTSKNTAEHLANKIIMDVKEIMSKSM